MTFVERTFGEITAKIAELETSNGDPFGFVRTDLVAYLDFASAKKYLKPEVVESDWKTSPRDEAAIIATIVDYLPFAWEKADDCRGLSAGRSLYHMHAWLWMLGEADAADRVMGEAVGYGQNVLADISRRFHFAYQWSGNVATLPWAREYPAPLPQEVIDHTHKGPTEGSETIPPAPALAPVRDNQGDAEPRKAHYGDGRQPWDDTLDAGWGPHAAAFCVIRYLRRDKAIEHSTESARWYAARLAEGAVIGKYGDQKAWLDTFEKLQEMLTPEEVARIGTITVKSPVRRIPIEVSL